MIQIMVSRFLDSNDPTSEAGNCFGTLSADRLSNLMMIYGHIVGNKAVKSAKKNSRGEKRWVGD
jgi:hypothetical protein